MPHVKPDAEKEDIWDLPVAEMEQEPSDRDQEELSDFKSLCEKFQSACRTNSPPVCIDQTEEKPILPPKISRIRFNPALQGVISYLENQVPVAAPLIATKPELLPKPELPPKPNGLSKDTFLVKTNDMKLSKVFRKTLSVTDSTRTNDAGMCMNHPQVYRQSMPAFRDPPREPNQPEVYEDVISAGRPPTPINDLKIAGSKPLPATEGLNSVKMTSTPVPDDNSAEDKKEKEVHKVPSLKILPSITSLGPPPSKPPRPPKVDLSAYFTGSSQQNGESNEPEESSEVEYEQPSSASEDGPIYDLAYSPKGSTESDSNVYEVDANDCDNPESVNPAPEDSRSPESSEQLWDIRKRLCAELIAKRQSQVLEPQGHSASGDGDFYDVAFSPKGSTESDSNVYEVDANDCDNPESVNLAADSSSLMESDESLCYEDILKLRESLSDRDFYDTDPVSSLETAYASEVSVSNNERSNKSSVSEGYYSADMDISNDSFQKKEIKIRKKEQTFRTKFKISGQENMLYTSVILEDIKPEKHLLPVKKGDTVEVIRIMDCPAGKWLARDVQGNYGFVPVASLQVFHEIKTFSKQPVAIPPADPDVYTDVEVGPKDSGARADSLKTPDSYSSQSDDQYDDIGNMSQTSNSSGGKGKVFGQFFRKDKYKKQDAGPASGLPNMNRTTSQEGEVNHSRTYVISDQYERAKEEKAHGWKAVFHKSKEQKGSEKPSTSAIPGLKRIAKEEKLFREKFKYTGEIKVINIAIINDLAPHSPKNKLEIAVKPGETVEIIDITSENQIICRNFAGKYGYVPIEYLNFR
ncbi:FYN-binding protein 2 [Bufo gargarizans]|uniref:FYN-binding protein 2 n=1 Tax=Bufo gargarizans TaxID=30331 RepID=UPI001CF37A61|nr:FYN-binding protein 2 [Bufo gargarizans]